MEMKRKLATITSIIVVLPVVLTACSNSVGSPSTSEAAIDKTPYDITMLLPLSGDLPPDNNPIEAKIEEYTNTKLNIQWSPTTSYDDKVNVTIASGELPKVIASPSHLTSSIQSAMKNGVFWEIGPLLTAKDFPKLAAINPLVFQNEAVNGKVYGLPMLRPLSRNSILFRKDWLDKLGLKPPETLDDLYKVIAAFTNNDPDGNGKKDTNGAADNKDMPFFDRIAEAAGSPNQWQVADGKVTPDFMTPQYLEAMKFYKKLYDEKLINTDFAATQKAQAQNAFYNGKSGMLAAVAGAASGAQIQFDKNKSGGVASIIPRLKGPDGKTIKFADPGYDRLLLLPKASVKTESEVKKILALFEHLGDDSMMMLLRYGIEGVHYKMQDGKPVYTDEAEYKRLVNEIQSNLKVLDFTDEVNKYLSPLDLQAQQIFKENEKFAIPNPAINLNSKTYTDQGTELETIIKDARTKFIMGQIDENGWKQQVNTWLTRGGQKMIDEYSASNGQSAGAAKK